jgi:hypothetical protein
MGETGTRSWGAVPPRRWTAVVAALLLVGAAVLEYALLKAECKGSLRSWGLCNVCGELTNKRLKYSVAPGQRPPVRSTASTATFRYYCPPCMDKAEGRIRIKETDREDWSAALRFGIQTVVLCVMGLGLVLHRWTKPGRITRLAEAGALLIGPVYVGAMLAGTPGSWLPLVVAGVVWGLVLFGDPTERPQPLPPRL